jgi:hypothetical protein
MRLGVPFIAPRQLGAVEVPIGRQFLPSVEWRTGHEQQQPGARSPSLSGAANRWTSGPVGAPDTVRCDQPTIGTGHTSLAGCAADSWRMRLWLTGQSGEF